MRLSPIFTRLEKLGIQLPVQTHADSDATIADAGGVEICVIDPENSRDDTAVFEITACLIELINRAWVLDMPENPTPSDLGAWAASQHDLPNPFNVRIVREIYNERRAARLRAMSSEAPNG